MMSLITETTQRRGNATTSINRNAGKTLGVGAVPGGGLWRVLTNQIIRPGYISFVVHPKAQQLYTKDFQSPAEASAKSIDAERIKGLVGLSNCEWMVI